MSIYPVSIKEWYKDPYDKGDLSDFGSEWENLQIILTTIKCCRCGKKIHWRYGYVHHSITFGYGDGWCSKKCLYGHR